MILNKTHMIMHDRCAIDVAIMQQYDHLDNDKYFIMRKPIFDIEFGINMAVMRRLYQTIRNGERLSLLNVVYSLPDSQ